MCGWHEFDPTLTCNPRIDRVHRITEVVLISPDITKTRPSTSEKLKQVASSSTVTAQSPAVTQSHQPTPAAMPTSTSATTPASVSSPVPQTPTTPAAAPIEEAPADDDVDPEPASYIPDVGASLIPSFETYAFPLTMTLTFPCTSINTTGFI